MKKLFFSAALCCVSLLMMAEAGPVCAGKLTNATGGRVGEFAYTEWETDAEGNVNVTVYKDAATSWRGRGLADAVTNAKGFELWLPGEAVATEISNYFDKNYTSGAKVYQLKKKDGVTIPDGTVIKMVASKEAANICWQTGTDNNGFGKVSFEYLYGSSCVHAESLDVAEEAQPVCAQAFTSDTYDGDTRNPALSPMTLSIETNEAGAVVIAIVSTVDGQTASFRDYDALGVNSFSLSGETAGHYFTTNQKDGDTVYVLTPYVDINFLTLIHYNGTLRWKTTGHDNCYKKNVQFDYTYGTSCTVTPTPMENVNNNDSRKVLIDGRMYILIDGIRYDALGRMVK